MEAQHRRPLSQTKEVLADQEGKAKKTPWEKATYIMLSFMSSQLYVKPIAKGKKEGRKDGRKRNLESYLAST